MRAPPRATINHAVSREWRQAANPAMPNDTSIPTRPMAAQIARAVSYSAWDSSRNWTRARLSEKAPSRTSGSVSAKASA